MTELTGSIYSSHSVSESKGPSHPLDIISFLLFAFLISFGFLNITWLDCFRYESCRICCLIEYGFTCIYFFSLCVISIFGIVCVIAKYSEMILCIEKGKDHPITDIIGLLIALSMISGLLYFFVIFRHSVSHEKGWFFYALYIILPIFFFILWAVGMICLIE